VIGILIRLESKYFQRLNFASL